MNTDHGTKERLLEAAQAHYLEGGFATFSLREVARRVGVSPAAVYRHFDGKEALVAAVCESGFTLFASYLVRALAEASAERLAAMIWATVHGLSSLRITGHFSQLGDEEAFASFYVDAVDRLLRGLAPKRRPARS